MLPSTALLLACFLDYDQSALRARDSTGDTNKVTFDIDQDNFQALRGDTLMTQVTSPA